jgi:hypothetical protein
MAQNRFVIEYWQPDLADYDGLTWKAAKIIQPGAEMLEVVSKPQIRSKGPAWQRDFASDLFKCWCSARRDNPPHILSEHWGLLSSFTNLSNRCEIPLRRAGRWGFETTSSEIYLTHPILFHISIGSEVHLVSDVDLYFEIVITLEPLFSILCAAASARDPLINRSSHDY